MGRHRRHAAGRAATGRATGVTQADGSYTESYAPQDSYTDETAEMGMAPDMGTAPYLNPEAYADAYARSHEYLYAAHGELGRSKDTGAFTAEGFAPDGGSRPPGPGGRRRRKKAATPVKTGLLGVSAAVALGTVAVATGVVPGLESYKLGGGTSTGDRVQAADSPTNSASEQGGASGSADETRGGSSTSRDTTRSTSPSASPSASPSVSATPTETATEKPSATPTKEPERTTPKTTSKKKQKSTSTTLSAEVQAATQVLKLVNEERAKVGCSPVAANSALADLAQDFSEDMAARNFFDHTDPDGKSPWDRAAKAGITDLGGENIARGQADAAAVMEAWMNSPGHRANILNCSFKTLGVGVHMGSGGPWWTQDFGY